jgi:hypothetical protein
MNGHTVGLADTAGGPLPMTRLLLWLNCAARALLRVGHDSDSFDAGDIQFRCGFVLPSLRLKGGLGSNASVHGWSEDWKVGRCWSLAWKTASEGGIET